MPTYAKLGSTEQYRIVFEIYNRGCNYGVIDNPLQFEINGKLETFHDLSLYSKELNNDFFWMDFHTYPSSDLELIVDVEQLEFRLFWDGGDGEEDYAYNELNMPREILEKSRKLWPNKDNWLEIMLPYLEAFKNAIVPQNVKELHNLLFEYYQNNENPIIECTLNTTLLKDVQKIYQIHDYQYEKFSLIDHDTVVVGCTNKNNTHVQHYPFMRNDQNLFLIVKTIQEALQKTDLLD